MKIYGLMFISLCMLIGNSFGQFLGRLLGIPGNVGGVGFAMLLLLFSVNYLQKRDMFTDEAKAGISFWSDMYIPIVIAMTAIQNVVAAVNAGLVPLIGGLSTVLIAFALLSVSNKIALKARNHGGPRADTGRQAVDL